ncbi:MAG: type II toxin-antitoxin system RelE/ParE family toxin [Methylomarinum sp.]|nr:type II toxin-antitoxin system RelE/ParE family toxin [Methylomarinum sp.]
MKYEIVTTSIFTKWMKKLKDRQAVKAIAMRMDRAILGNLGDINPVGQGVSEMRIFVGKGYRVYFVIRNNELVVLLCGGDKSSQQEDIEQAKKLAILIEES